LREFGTEGFGEPPSPLRFFEIALDQDDVSLNRHPDLTPRWSMIFSENRFPLFRIML